MAFINTRLQRFEICATPTSDDLAGAPDTPISRLYSGKLSDGAWLLTCFFDTTQEHGYIRALATAVVEPETSNEFKSHDEFDLWATKHCANELYALIARHAKSQMPLFDLELEVPLQVEAEEIVQLGVDNDSARSA